ncbi:MAG: bactofilin family protein [bacterium]
MFSRAKKNNDKSQESKAGLVEIGDDSPANNKLTKNKAPNKMLSGNARSGKSAPRNSGVPSLISGDVIMRGTIESQGEVQFDGALEGDIKAKGLVIGDGATVKGEIIADKVKVSGQVEGAIRAEKVELAASAVVKGDILHTSLAIESGARLDGNCRYSDNPKSEKNTKKTMTRSTPTPRVVSSTPDDSQNASAEEVVADADIINMEQENTPEDKSVAQSGSSFLSRAGKSDLR